MIQLVETDLFGRLLESGLVGRLNDVFTSFDELVAELALRIRDHVATHEAAGRRPSLRTGINSGSVIVGIIGTHKFAYDVGRHRIPVKGKLAMETYLLISRRIGPS